MENLAASVPGDSLGASGNSQEVPTPHLQGISVSSCLRLLVRPNMKEFLALRWSDILLQIPIEYN